MGGCSAYGCTNSSQKGFRLFRFPWNPKRRKQWAVAVKRADPNSGLWMPNDNARICAAHFVSGCPSSDPAHVDYVPTKFEHATKKAEERHERHKRYLALSEKRKTMPVASVGEEPDLLQDSDECAGQSFALEEETGTAVQTDPVSYLCTNCASMNSENNALKEQIINLERQNAALQKKTASISDISTTDDGQFVFYTGLSKALFLTILTTVVPALPPPRSNFPYPCQLFMFLMKLRLNAPFQDLAYRFHVTRKTAGRTFRVWLQHLSQLLQGLVAFPPPNVARSWLPDKDYQHFPRLRCIIDCSEVSVARPTNLETQQQAWSNYKQRCTLKYLVCVNPLGAVCFVSQAYGGRISDRQVVLKSGLLDLLQAGDQILADRGFLLHEEFFSRDVHLITPSFTKGMKQLPQELVCRSRRVSSSRIIVERAIGHIKKWRIMSETVPHFLRKDYSDILTVVAALTNMMPPLVRE